MAYKALYRKWRPEIFDEVIGQHLVVRTLKNQVKKEEFSHAYLFSGIRGTGKTSTAKIFARAINCLNPQQGDPCNRCEVCRGILSEQTMDVMEIDAASNNGVDHIRELRENVKYTPVKGRYKVYIIDEVHMLSGGAFNALLKTLEEPPDHVVFVLATTELHKIPPTVLSRCMRLQFKPLGVDEIYQRLETVCRSLNVSYEKPALTTLAFNGEGALRDSLSLLDQCLAYDPESLTYEQVAEILGCIDEALLFDLAAQIGRQNPLEAVRKTHQLYQEGKDLRQLITDMMKHFRWLLMASLEAPVDGWESLPEATRAQYREQSGLFQTQELTAMIRELSETEAAMKRTSQPQLLLENSLVRLCTKPGKEKGAETSEDSRHSVADLEQRIGRIEDFLRRLRQKQTERQKKTTTEPERPEDFAGASPPPQETTEPVEKEKEALAPSTPPETSREEETAEPGQLTLEQLRELWPHVLEQMRKDRKVSVQAMAREAKLQALQGSELTLAFDPEQAFLCQRMGRQDIREYVAGLIQQKTGRRFRLHFEVMEKETTQNEGTVETEAQLKRALPEEVLEIRDE